MSSHARSLPKAPDAIVASLDSHMDRMETLQAPRRAMWWMLHYYLQGHRSFEVVDFLRSNVQPKITRFNIAGELETPIQILLQRKTLIESRLMTADFSPAVSTSGPGLSFVRKKAMATALLEATIDKADIRRAQKQIVSNLLTWGSCGCRPRIEDGKTLRANIQIIHPQNVFPWPYPDLDLHNQSGHIYREFVEMEQLTEMLKALGVSKNAITRNKKHMRLYQIPWGNAIFPRRDGPVGIQVHGKTFKDEEDTTAEVAEVREIFLGTAGRLSRYIVQVGDWIAVDEERDATSPMGFSRMMDDNSYWGQGLVEMAFGITQMFEGMMNKLVQNVKDMDRFGFLVMPRGYFNPANGIHDTGHGLKMVLIDPDMIDGNSFKAQQVAPATTGTLPQQVAAGLFNTINDLVPISRVLLGDAPGRVDNSKALQFLSQKADLPLTPLYEAGNELLGNAYRWITEELPKNMRTASSKIPITRASEDLAGLVLKEGNASLIDNPLDDTIGLEFKIRDSVPNDKEVRKQEAVELTEKGFQDPMELRAFNLHEGLNMAFGNYEEQAAYAKEGLAILTIVNDGEEPGRWEDHPSTVVKDIQVVRLKAFLARPEFMQFSPNVQEALFERLTFLERNSIPGGVLPPGVPSPEEFVGIPGEGGPPMGAMPQMGGGMPMGGMTGGMNV